MGTIYKTHDGREFKTGEQAAAHEKRLDHIQARRIALENNLASFLSNKSRLKAGLLKKSHEDLDKLWKEFQELIPRRKRQWASDDTLVKFEKAARLLHQAAVRWANNMQRLDDCREMIPKIRAALKAGESFWSDDLLDVPRGVW